MLNVQNQERPNPITRAIIDSTVDIGLKDIDEDPKRSIRKMTDLGRQFNRGRFMDDIYGMVQDLLRNDDSPYYTSIEHLLRNVERKYVKDFCVSFGYSGLTFGGRIIRENYAKSDYYIPWQLTVRINSSRPDSLSVSELENLIRQGQSFGIYVYIIRLTGESVSVNSFCELFQRYHDCAFMMMMPDHRLTADQIHQMSTVTNTMYLFRNDAASSPENTGVFRKNKMLFGIYAVYGNENAADWYNGNLVKTLLDYHSCLNMLVSDESCSIRNAQRVAKYSRNLRMHPEYPLVLFDLIGDCIQVNKIITEQNSDTYLELLENGDIRTSGSIISDFRHTISLEQILRTAFPKNRQ